MSVVRPHVAINLSVAVPPSSFEKITEYRYCRPRGVGTTSYHISMGTSVKCPTVLGRAYRIGAIDSAVKSLDGSFAGLVADGAWIRMVVLTTSTVARPAPAALKAASRSNTTR